MIKLYYNGTHEFLPEIKTSGVFLETGVSNSHPTPDRSPGTPLIVYENKYVPTNKDGRHQVKDRFRNIPHTSLF